MLIHDYEQFFLLTMSDLRDRLRKETEYDIIRACGLCRQLILDDNECLLDLANERHQLKIAFAINPFKFEVKIAGEVIKPTTMWQNLLPMSTVVKNLDKNKFKNIPAVLYKGREAKVEHVIKAASNFMGGIHSRPAHPQNPDEIALKAIYEESLTAIGQNIALKALKSICMVILLGLEPLEKVIKEGDIPAGGSSPQS